MVALSAKPKVVQEEVCADSALAADPVIAAKSAGLRYVNDQSAGIRRIRDGDAFLYEGPNGAAVSEDDLQRIKSLAIPPAWTDVWICSRPNGHLQATGRDARGRKQYRYHPRWRATRDETKYGRLMAFAHALPAIRKRVEEDLARPGLPREKVLATVLRLLEETHIRVGNEEYARANDSYGLTTLRDDHARIEGSKLRFRFRGKSGKEHQIDVRDPRLARIVKRSRDLPGEELFQYLTDDGEHLPISSTDVNDYLREISGQEFSAKDFRTWAGTVLTARALAEIGDYSSQAESKRNINAAIESVAGRLGNTRAVCRKCYVHPAVIDSYVDHTLIERMHTNGHAPAGLDGDEAATLALLEAESG